VRFAGQRRDEVGLDAQLQPVAAEHAPLRING